jgi:hypothetical protein
MRGEESKVDQTPSALCDDMTGPECGSFATRMIWLGDARCLNRQILSTVDGD